MFPELQKALKSDDEIETIVEYNPDLCEFILKNFNFRNRNHVRSDINRLCRSLKDGKWFPKTSNICFFKDKESQLPCLADGQNRLTAIIRSGTTVPIRTRFNISEEERLVMDTGASRSVGQVVQMNFSDVPAPKKVTAIFSSYLKLISEIKRPPILAEDVRIFYQENKEFIDVIQNILDGTDAKPCELLNNKTKRTAGISGATVKASMLLAYKAYPNETMQFLSHMVLQDGERWDGSCQPALLRDKLIKGKNQRGVRKVEGETIMYFCLSALRGWIKKENTIKLSSGSPDALKNHVRFFCRSAEALE